MAQSELARRGNTLLDTSQEFSLMSRQTPSATVELGSLHLHPSRRKTLTLTGFWGTRSPTGSETLSVGDDVSRTRRLPAKPPIHYREAEELDTGGTLSGFAGELDVAAAQGARRRRGAWRASEPSSETQREEKRRRVEAEMVLSEESGSSDGLGYSDQGSVAPQDEIEIISDNDEPILMETAGVDALASARKSQKESDYVDLCVWWRQVFLRAQQARKFLQQMADSSGGKGLEEEEKLDVFMGFMENCHVYRNVPIVIVDDVESKERGGNATPVASEDEAEISQDEDVTYVPLKKAKRVHEPTPSIEGSPPFRVATVPCHCQVIAVSSAEPVFADSEPSPVISTARGPTLGTRAIVADGKTGCVCDWNKLTKNSADLSATLLNLLQCCHCSQGMNKERPKVVDCGHLLCLSCHSSMTRRRQKSFYCQECGNDAGPRPIPKQSLYL